MMEIMRFIGGPADGQLLEVACSYDYWRVAEFPPLDSTVKPGVSLNVKPSVKTHLYRRKSFGMVYQGEES